MNEWVIDNDNQWVGSNNYQWYPYTIYVPPKISTSSSSVSAVYFESKDTEQEYYFESKKPPCNYYFESK